MRTIKENIIYFLAHLFKVENILAYTCRAEKHDSAKAMGLIFNQEYKKAAFFIEGMHKKYGDSLQVTNLTMLLKQTEKMKLPTEEPISILKEDS